MIETFVCTAISLGISCVIFKVITKESSEEMVKRWFFMTLGAANFWFAIYMSR